MVTIAMLQDVGVPTKNCAIFGGVRSVNILHRVARPGGGAGYPGPGDNLKIASQVRVMRALLGGGQRQGMPAGANVVQSVQRG